jgi:three-Cys-motif partner protein
MRAANYTGKEAAYIKNELLKAYLEPLFMIIGQQELRIGYVDCSAGPRGKGWGDQGEPASVANSLGIMEKCHNNLSEKFRKNVQFRGLYIERDKESFDRLESFLESESWGGVDTHCLKGDFCDLRGEILSWCGSRDFCFFFIDATEWRHIAIPTLEPFLDRPSSEFLISFMFESIVRAHGKSSFEEHVNAIFGKVQDTSRMGLESGRSLFNLYRRELKVSAPVIDGAIARCAHVRVVHPEKESTINDLVYLTWNPSGIVTFMQASEQLEIEQRKVRALARQSKKIKRTGQLEIFSADRFVEDEPAVDLMKVKEYWLAKLSSAPQRFGVSEFADMLEETGWFMDDFQKAFLELEREGKVRNLASTGMRTGDPVRYWANGNRGEFVEKMG